MRALAAHLSHERYACSPVHAASAPLPEAQPHAQAYLHCHTRAQQARLLKLLHSSTSLSVIGILTGYPGSSLATAMGPSRGATLQGAVPQMGRASRGWSKTI